MTSNASKFLLGKVNDYLWDLNYSVADYKTL